MKLRSVQVVVQRTLETRPRVFGHSRGACLRCGGLTVTQRWNSTKPAAYSKKPYYITTPIFYVNAAPHVGHLYSMVLADIFKRWQVLLGKQAILCTGTDEHGMKVQQAASKAGMGVGAFCDKHYKEFDTLAHKADVIPDRFIRTTDSDHKFAVEHCWLMLQERGYIYTAKHEGWYAVSDETFYPQSAVHPILDPQTGRKMMASIETGKEVEWTSEMNYHFRLSAFKDKLLEFYAKNPTFIIPAARFIEVLDAVSSGLQDLSVSRPVKRLSWGIRVPGDESQTIYVWLDALINYLTTARYPFQEPGKASQYGWPADCHVVGKDIVRFHCIYWPAFLMALDLPLPRQVLTHAHWTLGREKMSKSTGNVVNPFFALDRFGVDTMRYYLAHDGGIQDDADYGNEYIIERYTKGLKNSLGNLTSRIVRSKSWDVRRAVMRGTQGQLPMTEDHEKEQVARIENIAHEVKEYMKRLGAGAALKAIMDVIYATNRYLQHCHPWTIGDPQDTKGSPSRKASTPIPYANLHLRDQVKLDRIVFLCAEALRVCGILLQPYMPGKMEILLDMLGVGRDARGFEKARYSGDVEYGTSSLGLGKGTTGVLFPPLRSDS